MTSSFSMQLFSTPQVGDRLTYNGNVFSVWLYLPDEFYNLEIVNYDTFEFIDTTYVLAVNLFGDKKTCSSTGCGRGYIAEWSIIDDLLYLTGIYSCCYYSDSIEADLTLLFKEKVVSGKVKADWITGNFTSPQGKRIRYEHWGYGGFYEQELEFYFEKGKLTGTHLYNNTIKQSEYSQNAEKLREFIYSNINWEILPKQDKVIRVFIGFVPNENGFIDEVKVLRGYSELYDQEAIRIIKAIPEWEVSFRRGELIRMQWDIPVIFSNENRLRYQR